MTIDYGDSTGKRKRPDPVRPCKLCGGELGYCYFNDEYQIRHSSLKYCIEALKDRIDDLERAANDHY